MLILWYSPHRMRDLSRGYLRHCKRYEGFQATHTAEGSLYVTQRFINRCLTCATALVH